MSLKRSLLYGLANLAYFLSYSTFNTYVLFFYTDELHAPVRLITRAWLLFGIWNTLNDFIFGWLSDRLPSRLGRRTFFIVLFSVPVAAAFALMWSPPASVTARGETALFWYFLLSISVYDALLTAVNTGQVAAFPELVHGDNERSRVSAIRQALGIVGTVIGVAGSPLVYGHLGWRAMGAGWGALVGALFLISLAGLRSEPSDESAPDAQPGSAGRGIITLAREPLFRAYVGIQLGTRFALAFLQLVLPFLVAHALGLSPDQLSLTLAVMLGTALASLPLWPRIIGKLGARRAGVAVTAYLVLMLFPFLHVRDLPALLAVAAFVGPGYGGISVVLELLFAQVVDADQQQNGQSRAGVISGATGAMLRVAPALAGLILGEVLSRAGYDPRLPVQPASVGDALRALTFAGPALALALTGLLLHRCGIGSRMRGGGVRPLKSSPEDQSENSSTAESASSGSN